MRHRTSRFLLCLGAALFAISANGAEAWLEECFECHGADGMGKADPMYPVIAGIPAAHIEEAIYSYIDGARRCAREPRMCETVASLTAAQVSAAANYFSGEARDYNREEFLPELKIPVLFTAGRYDEARPATVAHFQSLVPGSRLAIFEQSGHLTMQDEPDEFNRVVGTFLNEVDARKQR